MYLHHVLCCLDFSEANPTVRYGRTTKVCSRKTKSGRGFATLNDIITGFIVGGRRAAYEDRHESRNDEEITQQSPHFMSLGDLRSQWAMVPPTYLASALSGHFCVRILLSP